jgi:ApbE superfamily uncharacterized protein (UPF0280 family)
MQYFISENELLVDYGPVQMTIKAKKGNKSVAEELWAAGEYVKKLLHQLAPFQQAAKGLAVKSEDISHLPEILRKMVAAVNDTGEPTLTPMAAVAGTFSDLVADFLFSPEMEYVIVNNGGDIAIRGNGTHNLKVGIAQAIEANQYTHYLEVDQESSIGGVATSGFGGRSFTKGIATAAVVAAESCRVADAWATLVGNAAFFPDPAILQVPANQIDPNTDLQGQLITAKVGNISPITVERALATAIDFAKGLIQEEEIKGAAVFYYNTFVCYPKNFAKNLR